MLYASSIGLAHAVGIHLKVHGYDDATSTILVTDGWEASVGTVVAHYHDTEYGEPPVTETMWDEELLEEVPIAWGPRPEYPVYEWTEYRAELPVSWLGRGISFSRDEEKWTSFKPFDGNTPDGEEQLIEIEQVELGEREIPNPDKWITAQGNRLRLGHWWNDDSRSVFSISSWDNANPWWPCTGMDIWASAANAYWRWNHPTDNGLGVSRVMCLDFHHRLSLIGRNNPSRTIVLDPDQGKILVDGYQLLNQLSGQNYFVPRSGNRVNLGIGTAVQYTVGYSHPGQLVVGKYNDVRANDQGVDHRRRSRSD